MDVDTTVGTTEAAESTTTGEVTQGEGSQGDQTTQSTEAKSSTEEPNWDDLLAKAPKDKLSALLSKDEEFVKNTAKNVRHSEIARRAQEEAKKIAASTEAELAETRRTLSDLQKQLNEARLSGMTDDERTVFQIQQERDAAKTQLARLQSAFSTIEEAVARDETFAKIQEDYELSDDEATELQKSWDKYAAEAAKANEKPSANRLLHMAGLLVKERAKTQMSVVDKKLAELTEKMAAFERVQSGTSTHAATSGGTNGSTTPGSDIGALEEAVLRDSSDTVSRSKLLALYAKEGVQV